MSVISRVFVEKSAFLKNFLKKMIASEHDVEDIIQEVYIRARQAEEKIQIEKPAAFLVHLAKNMAYDELTRKARQATGYIDEHLEEIPIERTASLESEEEAEESIRLYCQAIDQLPDKCKQIFLLRKVYGFKHKEIAQKLDVSLSSVEKNLKLAGLFCDEYLENLKDPASSSSGDAQRSRVRKA